MFARIQDGLQAMDCDIAGADNVYSYTRATTIHKPENGDNGLNFDYIPDQNPPTVQFHACDTTDLAPQDHSDGWQNLLVHNNVKNFHLGDMIQPISPWVIRPMVYFSSDS